MSIVQSPTSRVQRPKFSVQDPASRFQHAGSSVQHLRPESRNSGEKKRARLRETKELEQLKHLSSKIQEAASSFAITEKKGKNMSDKWCIPKRGFTCRWVVNYYLVKVKYMFFSFILLVLSPSELIETRFFLFLNMNMLYREKRMKERKNQNWKSITIPYPTTHFIYLDSQ